MTSPQPTVVLTGSEGPIGQRISDDLLKLGARVLGVDLKASTRHVGDSNFASIGVDFLEPQACEVILEFVRDNTEAVSGLVNNAAITAQSSSSGYAVPFLDQSDEAFDEAIMVGVSQPFRLSRRLVPLMLREANASIVNVASIYGLVGPSVEIYRDINLTTPAGYAASKGALIQLTRFLATTLAPEIRVNAVAPGGIERGQPPEFISRYCSLTPLRRMGREADVSDAVLWLLGSQSSYITGQILAVDGGWTAR